MDVVVTVPRGSWERWENEGDLPGDPWSGLVSHFWLGGNLPRIRVGERVYIVAHGKLRGYAPLFGMEQRCRLRPRCGCLMRSGDAVAVTIDQPIRGFQGYRYRHWSYDEERPFPEWQTA